MFMALFFSLVLFRQASFNFKSFFKKSKSVDATFSQANGNYILNSYLNEHTITKDLYEFSSNGNLDGYTLANLTQNSGFWVSSQPCTDSFKPAITYTFGRTVSLEAFLFLPAYRTLTDTRSFDGFPTKLNVYASIDDGPEELEVVFSGNEPTSKTWTTTQFVFPQRIVCDKIRLEFVTVTECGSFGLNNARYAAAQKIVIIGDLYVNQLTSTGTTDKYSQSDYVSARKIPKTEFQYSTNSGSQSDKPLDQAFDDNSGTYFVSSTEINDTFKSTITIEFNEVKTIEAFLYDTAYRTRNPDTGTVRYFDGFPTKLNVYISTTNTEESLVLDSVFVGNPVHPMDRIQFVFKKPTEVRRLKLEFVEVTPNESFDPGKYTIATGGIYFLKYIYIPPPTQSPVATPVATPTASPFPHLNLVYEKANGDYANTDYVNSHKIDKSLFEVTSNGDKSNYPLTNAFDSTSNSFWVSSQPNSDTFKATVTFSFTKTVELKAFLYNPAFHTRSPVRYFDGFPTKMNFYASLGDGEFELLSSFSGETPTSTTWDLTQYVFMYTIRCDKLKVEFNEVTPNDSFGLGNATQAAASEMKLIGRIAPDYLAPASTSDSYAQPQYVAAHRIPVTEFDARSNGNSKQGYPLSNAFDRVDNSYWVAEQENSDTFKSAVTLEFNELKTIDAILWDTAYRTRHPSTGTVRYFDGFPTILNVYTSQTEGSNDNDDSFILNTVFQGQPVFPWMRVQFVFKQPIQCRRIKLELFNVTSDESFSNGAFNAVAAEIYIMSPSEQKPDPTSSPKPTKTPTASAVATPKATQTPTPMATMTPTASISMTPMATPTPMATLTATPYPTPTASATPDPMNMRFEQANGDYANTNYVNSNKIADTFFEVASNGDKSNYPLTNAFDNNARSFWVSSEPNSDTFKATITFTFIKTVELKAFLFNPAYHTRNPIRYFDGFPTKLIFYASIDDGPFELVTIFNGEAPTSTTWDLTQFVFKHPIRCNKLKIEFAEVSPNDSFGLANAKQAAAAEMKLIGIVLPDYIDSKGLEGFYNVTEYTDSHTISTDEFTFTSNGDKSGQPISNAFDGNTSTYWASGTENSDSFKATITINFNEIKTVDALLISPAYRTRNPNGQTVRYFDGFPTTLNVYSSKTTTENSLFLDTVFEGNPQYPWSTIQFVFKKPIQCRKLKLEFKDVTLDESFWKTKYCAVVGDISILQDAEKPPVLLPDQSGTITTQPGQCNQKYRCDQNVTENKVIILDIKETNFSSYQNEKDGGAISLINCGFECKKTSFIDCKSERGGGAIFFKNEHDQIQNELKLENIHFEDCSAIFGGAAYVCSTIAFVTIRFCEFYNMNLLPPLPTSGEFQGGSGLFLTISYGDVKDLYFKKCMGTTMKIHPDFGYQPFSLKSKSNKVVSISKCSFESDENTKASIFFVRSSSSKTTFNVVDCVFSGKLNTGSRFIDGKSSSVFNNSPKLLVSRCKFESSLNKAIDVDKCEQFMSIDLKDQEFIGASNGENKKSDNLSNLKVVFLVVAPVALVAIVTLIVVLVIRRKKDNNMKNKGLDEVEMSVENSQDLLYHSNYLVDQNSLNQSLI